MKALEDLRVDRVLGGSGVRALSVRGSLPTWVQRSSRWSRRRAIPSRQLRSVCHRRLRADL